MGDQDVFERILESLHDAMLDDSHWPDTSALIQWHRRPNFRARSRYSERMA